MEGRRGPGWGDPYISKKAGGSVRKSFTRWRHREKKVGGNKEIDDGPSREAICRKEGKKGNTGPDEGLPAEKRVFLVGEKLPDCVLSWGGRVSLGDSYLEKQRTFSSFWKSIS